MDNMWDTEIVPPLDAALEIPGVDEEVRTTYRCSMCAYSCNRRGNLKRHKSAFHKKPEALPTTSFLCMCCGKNFKSKEGLKIHDKSIHKREFKFRCDVCDKGFNVLCNFRGHLDSHYNALREKSATCKTTFKYKKTLKEHEKGRGAGKQRNTYECSSYPVLFASKSSLKEHIDVVHKEMVRRCSFCGKKPTNGAYVYLTT